MGFDALSSLNTGAQTFTSLLSGISQSRAISAASEFQAGQLELNAQFADLFAEDAISRGNEALQDFGARVRQLKGAQRAGFAGQNVQVGTGSAREVREDTDRIATDASIRLRNNAWREAWGFNIQAENLRAQAALSRIGGKFEAGQTLLSGITQASGFGLRSLNFANKALENFFKNNQRTNSQGLPAPTSQTADLFIENAFGFRPGEIFR